MDTKLNKESKAIIELMIADGIITRENAEKYFPELKSEDERIRTFLHKTFTEQYLAKDKLGKWHGEPVVNILAWLEKKGKEEYALKSFKDEDVHEFVQYIERQAKAYELNLPNRNYDIYGFAKDILSWFEKQGECNNKVSIDEKLYEHIRNTCACIDDAMSSETLADINDYLSMAERSAQSAFDMIEKQGEQNLANSEKTCKDEPRFKVGDWLIRNDIVGVACYITQIHESYYLTNKHSFIHFGEEDKYRLWTIQDAKDGDVLADGNLPFIFKKIDANKYSYAYCGISVDDGFKIESDGESGEWTWMQDIKPATQEQCDLLFQKMKEAGYKWDAEKKELKKEEVDNLHNYLYGEQKPAWSEKNEAVLDALIRRLEGEDIYVSPHLAVECLKSLKERVQPQPKQEWSEEDEGMLNSSISFVEHSAFTTAIGKGKNNVLTWLKSLKERYTWRPSDKQIDDLKYIMTYYPNIRGMVNSIYTDLKKLKG